MSFEFDRLPPVHVFIVLLHFGTFVVSSKPQVPCYFIFGDSLVDSGNNNKLKTKCKVNYSPYGIDFPEGDTGRFTNGRTSADIIDLTDLNTTNFSFSHNSSRAKLSFFPFSFYRWLPLTGVVAVHPIVVVVCTFVADVRPTVVSYHCLKSDSLSTASYRRSNSTPPPFNL
ncbi:hypothetical protein L1887_34402 [Cichorium endivia]|nr:hypothetical protein L1887_34402 [Cichorium endivia]